jgi:hypothetical protein
MRLTIAKNWLEIPNAIGVCLWDLQQKSLFKGAGHKYVRRVLTGKKSPKYKYYYNVTGGAGLGHKSEFAVGAKFMIEGGHYEIVKVSGNTVTVKHDETGKIEKLMNNELISRLRKHHDKKIGEAYSKTLTSIQEVMLHGSEKQKKRVLQQAKKIKELFGSFYTYLPYSDLDTVPAGASQKYIEQRDVKNALVDFTGLIKTFRQLYTEENAPDSVPKNLQQSAKLVAHELASWFNLNPSADFEGNREVLNVYKKRAEYLLGERRANVSDIWWLFKTANGLADGKMPKANWELRNSETSGGNVLAVVNYDMALEELKLEAKYMEVTPEAAIFVASALNDMHENYYGQDKGTRTGYQLARKLVSQVRTFRGVDAVTTLLSDDYRYGKALAVESARSVIGFESAGSQYRSAKKAFKALREHGWAQAKFTSQKPAADLEVAIQADVKTVMQDPHGSRNPFNVASRINLKDSEIEAQLHYHRWNDVDRKQSKVKQLFSEKFGTNIVLENNAFDHFIDPMVLSQGKNYWEQHRIDVSTMRGIDPKDVPKYVRPEDQKRAKRIVKMERSGWGIAAIQPNANVTRDEKIALNELREAVNRSHEAKKNAITAVYNALDDFQKVTGSKLDLSGLPLIIADDSVAILASAHYTPTHDKKDLDRTALSKEDLKPKDLQHTPHIAIGTKFEKSVAHELSHYLDNRMGTRIGNDRESQMEGAVKTVLDKFGYGQKPFTDKEDPDGSIAKALHKEMTDLYWDGGTSKFFSVPAAWVAHQKSDPGRLEGVDGGWNHPLAKRTLAEIEAGIISRPGGKEIMALMSALGETGHFQRLEAKDEKNPNALFSIAEELNKVKYSKMKKAYYTNGTEVLARAIEQHVHHKLADQNIINPALTHVTYDGKYDRLNGESAYFDPDVFRKKIQPHVEKVLRYMTDNMTKSRRLVIDLVKARSRAKKIEGQLDLFATAPPKPKSAPVKTKPREAMMGYQHTEKADYHYGEANKYAIGSPAYSAHHKAAEVHLAASFVAINPSKSKQANEASAEAETIAQDPANHQVPIMPPDEASKNADPTSEKANQVAQSAPKAPPKPDELVRMAEGLKEKQKPPEFSTQDMVERAKKSNKYPTRIRSGSQYAKGVKWAEDKIHEFKGRDAGIDVNDAYKAARSMLSMGQYKYKNSGEDPFWAGVRDAAGHFAGAAGEIHDEKIEAREKLKQEKKKPAPKPVTGPRLKINLRHKGAPAAKRGKAVVGEKREWADGIYQKQGDGTWIKIAEKGVKPHGRAETEKRAASPGQPDPGVLGAPGRGKGGGRPDVEKTGESQGPRAKEPSTAIEEITKDGPIVPPPERAIPDGRKVTIPEPDKSPAIALAPDLWPQLEELPPIPSHVANFPNPAPLTTSDGKVVGHIERLFDHQAEGAQRILKAWADGEGAILQDDAGLGKTNTALAAIVAHGGKRNLIVVPTAGKEGLKVQWMGERSAGLYNVDVRGAEVVTSSTGKQRVIKRHDQLSPTDEGTFIVSYDELWEPVRDAEGNPTKDERGRTVKKLRESIMQGNWDTVVFDESHNMKNPGTLTGKASVELQEKASKVLYMSATPYTNISDMHYLRKLGYFKTDEDFLKWAELAGAEVKGSTVQNPSSYLPRAAIAAMLHVEGKSIKRSTSLDGVTSKFGVINPEGLTEEERQAFATAEFIIDLAKTRVKGWICKALYSGWAKQYWEICKVKQAIKTGEQALADGKQVAFFTSYKLANHEHLRAIPRMLYNWADKAEMSGTPQGRARARELAGLANHIAHYVDQLPKGKSAIQTLVDHFGGPDKVAEIHGNTSKKPHVEQADYQAGKKKVVVATIARGGTGISLHDTTGESPRVQINLSLPYSGREFNQVAGRSHRLGSKSDTTMHWLIGDDESEKKLALIVSKKLKSMGCYTQGNPDATVEASSLMDFDFSSQENVTDDAAEEIKKISEMIDDMGEGESLVGDEKQVFGVPQADEEKEKEKKDLEAEHSQAARDYFREFAMVVKEGRNLLKERYDQAQINKGKKAFREAKRAAEQMRQHFGVPVVWRSGFGMFEIENGDHFSKTDQKTIRKKSIGGIGKTYGTKQTLTFMVPPDGMEKLAAEFKINKMDVDLKGSESMDPEKRGEIEKSIDDLARRDLRATFYGHSTSGEPIYLITGQTYKIRGALWPTGVYDRRNGGYLIGEDFLRDTVTNIDRFKEARGGWVNFELRPKAEKQAHYSAQKEKSEEWLRTHLKKSQKPRRLIVNL